MQYSENKLYRMVVIIVAALTIIFTCTTTVFPRNTPDNFVLMYQFSDPIMDSIGRSKVIGIRAIDELNIFSENKTVNILFDDLGALEGCNISNIQISPPTYRRPRYTAVIYCSKQ